MTKRQAAQILGVQIRTIERYLSAGKLPYTQTEVDGKVVDDLAEEDVLALRAARDAAAAAREQRVIPPTVMQHVSFRVEPEYLQVLEIEAARRKLKRTEFARQLFCTALTEGQTREAQIEEIRGDLQRLGQEVGKLRRNMGELLYQVLVMGVKASEDEAREWVGELFGS